MIVILIIISIMIIMLVTNIGIVILIMLTIMIMILIMIIDCISNFQQNIAENSLHLYVVSTMVQLDISMSIYLFLTEQRLLFGFNKTEATEKTQRCLTIKKA